MLLHGWGRYPRTDAEVLSPPSSHDASRAVSPSVPQVAFGLGRSYGDSALAGRVIRTDAWDRYMAFDEGTGDLTCEAGVSLDHILRMFVPRGWFLPVTPGTRFVTVGGAIASDVHGKNHHVEGSFCDHVSRMEILLGNGERMVAAPTQNADLFHATCGGMGLTGIILNATFRLKPIRSSLIEETIIKAPNLEAVLDGFTERASATYSVAWIDCLARGRQLGRSLLMVGEHADSGPLRMRAGRPLPVPFQMPAALLNHATVQAFNTAFYGKARRGAHTHRTRFEPFFHPLDILAEWNRLYGKPGFVQYQFVLPLAAGPAGLRDVLERIARSGRGSFLAVLKVFGKGNRNLLSFPMEGYTLALDFKVEPAVLALLDELDRVVVGYGGRLYLTKDARMSTETFRAGYPRWEEFQRIREKYGALGRFASLQSARLGMEDC